jgi:hypothetical protein
MQFAPWLRKRRDESVFEDTGLHICHISSAYWGNSQSPECYVSSKSVDIEPKVLAKNNGTYRLFNSSVEDIYALDTLFGRSSRNCMLFRAHIQQGL